MLNSSVSSINGYSLNVTSSVTVKSHRNKYTTDQYFAIELFYFRFSVKVLLTCTLLDWRDRNARKMKGIAINSGVSMMDMIELS